MLREMKRLTVIFIVLLIFFCFLNQSIIYNAEANQNEQSTPSRFALLKALSRIIGQLFGPLFKPIIRLSVVATAAVPPAIEIGYNETVKLDIGMWDTETNKGFEVQEKPPEKSIYTKRVVDFEVIEYPGGSNDHGSWFITFNPFSIDVNKGVLIKSTASISLTSPPSASNPIQSGILKIRVFDTWAYRSLFFPPKGHTWDVPFKKWLWFLGATITAGYARFSGTVYTDYMDVDILVKVKPYHALRFDTLPLIRLNPDQITSIPVRLQNLGNYNDTYSFRIVNNNDITLTTPYSITLAPGETKNTYLGVSAPQNIFDYGTIRQITIEGYSIDDPDVTIAKRTINFESKGLYISEIVGGSFVFMSMIIIIGAALLIHRRRIFLDKYCIKPDKPWEIPKEKEYLDKLKKSDEDKYNEASKMMQDEYKSALLWYKYYCKKIIEPKPVKKIKKEKIKLKPLKKEKKKIFKILEKKEKPAVKEISDEDIEAKRKELEIMKKKEKEKRKQEKLRQIEIKKKMKEEKLKEKEERTLEKEKEKERQLEQKKIKEEIRKRQDVLLKVNREKEKQKRKFGL